MQRRLAQGDADTVHLNGRKQLDQAALEPLRHTRGIGVQEQLRQPREDLAARSAGRLSGRYRIARGPGLPAPGVCGAPVLKSRMRTGSGICRSLSPSTYPRRVAELFELHQRLAPVLRAGATEDFDGTRSEPDPVLAGQRRQGHETAQQEQPPHDFIVSVNGWNHPLSALFCPVGAIGRPSSNATELQIIKLCRRPCGLYNCN